jgi:tetratricopeptide (TPR) repeat protein
MTLYALAALAILVQGNLESKQLKDFQSLLTEGRAEFVSGHFAAAEELYIQALAHLPPGHEPYRAEALADLGTTRAREEEFAKAEQAYSDSLFIFKGLSDKSSCALVLHHLGMLYSTEGRLDDAMRLLSQAQDLMKSIPQANPKIAVVLLNGIGMIHYLRGNNGKAETSFKQVLQMVSSSNIDFDTAGVLNNLGVVYVAQGKFKQAEEILRRALQIKETELGLVHPDLIPILTSMGEIFTETRRYGQAENQYQRALRIADNPQHPGSAPVIARLLRALSIMYLKEGRKSESDAALEESAKIARLNLEKEPEMAAIVDAYSEMLRARGRTKEARELRAEANRARMVMGLVVSAHSQE